VPIGVFLIAHLTTNSSLVWGKFGLRGEYPELGFLAGGVAYFWKEVKWINEQIPHLLLIEIVLWVSIAFHSALGVVYARAGKNNLQRYAYQDNWRYTLQRISGYVGIFYIFYHVATLRWGWTFLIPPFDGSVKWSHDYSVSTLVAALQGGYDGYTFWGLLVSLFYFVGVSLLVFHFANGLWTAAITWGLTISRKAQQRWGLACAGLGVGLMAMAWSSLFITFITDPNVARETEQKLLDARGGPTLPAPAPAPITPPTPNP
jgi:succinate dehydrogenase / fumarate reductase cytochrome b subunit